jgi:pilus assembly protein CpaD
MKIRPHPIAVSMMLALAACVTEYSATEAPKALQVNGGETRVDLAFAPGSDRLAPGEAARLERLVLAGDIRPPDRVTIAAGGTPSLADRRAAAISSELLRYGIVADTLPPRDLRSDRATLSVGRYTVTLPPCPNWSRSFADDFTNSIPSWYGCADATNLGLMVASPADLASGRPLAPADGIVAVNAVERYLNDRVKQPPALTASPFAASAGGGGEAGGASGGAPGGAPGAGGP